MNETYNALLLEGAVLKLQAQRLADIGNPIEAAAVFRRAAQKELDALNQLEPAPPETVAGAKVEAAGLLMAAGDLREAFELLLTIPVDFRRSPTGSAMLSQLLEAFPVLQKVRVCESCRRPPSLISRGDCAVCSCGKMMTTL